VVFFGNCSEIVEYHGMKALNATPIMSTWGFLPIEVDHPNKNLHTEVPDGIVDVVS
jgi:hypothetical protein